MVFFILHYLTNSNGNDPSMSLNSSWLSWVDINEDKWKNLTRRGMSVNVPKSLLISGLDFSEYAEISIGVSFFFSQTAAGSTLRESIIIWSKENRNSHPKSSKSRTKLSLPISTASCRIVPDPPCSGVVLLTWLKPMIARNFVKCFH